MIMGYKSSDITRCEMSEPQKTGKVTLTDDDGVGAMPSLTSLLPPDRGLG